MTEPHDAAFEDAHRKVREFQAMDFQAMDGAAIRRALQSLADLLPAHFADEVRPGGFFDRLRANLPRREAEIDRLAREHIALIGEADDLAEDLDKSDLDDELRLRVTRFANRMSQHEFRESALAAQAYSHTEL